MARYDEARYQAAKEAANGLMVEVAPEVDGGKVLLLQGELAIIRASGRTLGSQGDSDYYDPEVRRVMEVIREYTDTLANASHPPSLFYLPEKVTEVFWGPFFIGALASGMITLMICIAIFHK